MLLHAWILQKEFILLYEYNRTGSLFSASSLITLRGAGHLLLDSALRNTARCCVWIVVVLLRKLDELKRGGKR